MNLENHCGTYIKHINDVLQRQCNNALQANGLTLSQLTVLHLLDNASDGKMTLKELEKQLQVAQSTTAGIVSRLEQKGFVEGFGSVEDKRIKYIQITPKGEVCLLDSQIHALESEAHLLSVLSESEQTTLHALLKKIHESI